MSFLFRPHREFLAEAMAKVVELADWDALAAHVAPLKLLSVDKYTYDERIGWNTHIVMCEYSDGAQAPAGFTNGPVER